MENDEQFKQYITNTYGGHIENINFDDPTIKTYLDTHCRVKWLLTPDEVELLPKEQLHNIIEKWQRILLFKSDDGKTFSAEDYPLIAASLEYAENTVGETCVMKEALAIISALYLK